MVNELDALKDTNKTKYDEYVVKIKKYKEDRAVYDTLKESNTKRIDTYKNCEEFKFIDNLVKQFPFHIPK
jgi:hypothetical protein